MLVFADRTGPCWRRRRGVLFIVGSVERGTRNRDKSAILHKYRAEFPQGKVRQGCVNEGEESIM